MIQILSWLAFYVSLIFDWTVDVLPRPGALIRFVLRTRKYAAKRTVTCVKVNKFVQVGGEFSRRVYSTCRLCTISNSLKWYKICLKKFGKYVENTGPLSKDTRVIFLSPLTSIHVQKNTGDLTFWPPVVIMSHKLFTVIWRTSFRWVSLAMFVRYRHVKLKSKLSLLGTKSNAESWMKLITLPY
jgi:hypothetical protein